MVWKGDSRGRLAKSLITLIDQVDAAWPNRQKHSDGSIGDRAHQARPSDHNPGPDKVVEALDITHDVAHGVDTWALAETLRLNRDPRIDYVISNGRVFVGNHGNWNGRRVEPYTWIRYTGSNNHARHVHVSVIEEKMDEVQPWNLKRGDDAPPATPAPPPPKPPGITTDMRRRMMAEILTYEGRFQDGKLQIFIAPDGNPEIGGITKIDHPVVYAKLKALLADQPKLREAVLDYYDEYTDAAQNWTDQAGLEFFLRDSILNRGAKGAAEILQRAVGVEVDHQVGPTTRGALAALPVDTALAKLRTARELYEEIKYGKQNRINRGQWQGLVNRWNKAEARARQYQQEQATNAPPPVVVPPPPIQTAPMSFWDRLRAWFAP